MAVDRFAEFTELQNRYPRSISNDFMLPAEIRSRLSGGLLSFSAENKALFMFERREGFVKLHFRLIDSSAVFPPQDVPVAAYLVYRKGRYPDAAADWLRGQGFTYKKTLIRHTANEITDGPSYDRVGNASVDETYSMIGEFFSPAEADLPPREFFDPHGAFCARSPDGRIIGLVYDMGQTRVVAVSPESRGQGIGRRLYRAYAEQKSMGSKGSVFHEWISPDNDASLLMFRALGFFPDATMSECFVL